MSEAVQAASALPYVSWSNATFATIPGERWAEVYGSMQALKGHIQEYPGLQRFDVRVHCYTTWDTPEQLEAFAERGYTVARMLSDIAGVQADVIRGMEKIF